MNFNCPLTGVDVAECECDYCKTDYWALDKGTFKQLQTEGDKK